MADLALLEDLAQAAFRRECVFRDRWDFFAESTDWLIRYTVVSKNQSRVIFERI
jgi:hypothetical protein